MTVLRLLNAQGLAGLAMSLCLAILLVIEKGETRHWRKDSGRFEQLYRGEQTAFGRTVADYRAAADQARAADTMNAQRIADEQRSINERTEHDYETRLADARAAAERLRLQPSLAADPRSRRGASMPGLPAAAGSARQAAGQDGLSRSDRLTATEQSIQLDELIKWVLAQAAVDNGPPPVASRPSD